MPARLLKVLMANVMNRKVLSLVYNTLSAHSKSAVFNSKRVTRQTEALKALKTAGRITAMSNL